MLNKYFADLHIHIGVAGDGQPVKITASKRLNFTRIAEESLKRKGLNMVGIIDCASPPVIEDIERLLGTGEMKELAAGGLQYKEDLVIIPGAEVESREKNGGQAHYLAYFPFLTNIKEFSEIMKEYITNINLSSQSTGLSGRDILQIVTSTGGLLIPAHIFTPFKSFYGKSFSSYREVFSSEEWSMIPAVELGLSADTFLADHLTELEQKTFLSNSDAHSLGNIAREYNLLRMQEPNFQEFKLVLEGKKGRGVEANFGLDPRLGKYHRSFCENCDQGYDLDSPVYICPQCGSDKIVIGVKDRIYTIADKSRSKSPVGRPQYIHQIPLLDIPGIGPKTLNSLLEKAGTEMKIIHQLTLQELRQSVSLKIAKLIIKSRTGDVKIKSGGGGNYGKVIN